MNIIKKILFNPWVKSIVILSLCFFGTYYVISQFSGELISLFNWRSKEFWATLAIVIPSAMLFPTMVNGFMFLKITQIADNTYKTQKLLKEQNELLKKILEKNK